MTTSPQRKKLIEVSIPLEAINAASAREKSIRHGHPSTLHLWWARRPLAACRAVLFSQLVDDPSSWPDRFPTEEKQDVERRRLHRIIERMLPWEASNDENILNEARWEIARSVAWGLGEEPPAKGDGDAILAYLQVKAPPVYDPFSGGGSIPLEAQRLGLRAYGSDLNPVAVLIGKALVEIPPKFARRPPVNPKARKELERGHWNGKGAQGLAEDVRYYGQWMRDEAEKRIGQLYPKATLPDGSEATVIAWLWARTVRSPDPAAKGAMVPLLSSYMLGDKDSRRVWVQPLINSNADDGYSFSIVEGKPSANQLTELKRGNKGGRAGFTCLLTGAAISFDYIRQQAAAEGLSKRLIGLLVQDGQKRRYISAQGHDVVPTEMVPKELCADGLVTTPAHDVDRLPMYGMPRWRDAFTPRQLTALSTFASLVSEARDLCINAFLAAMETPSGDDEAVQQQRNAEEYGRSIAAYLALSVGRAADYWSTIATWVPTGEFVRNTFARQAIAMSWDFVESNPFSNATGNWMGSALEWIPKVIERLPATGEAQISQIVAQKNNYPIRPVAVSTDPPYYDNIGYADLSDFFYVWHRQALGETWPELFRRLLVPKDEELVASPHRHGGRDGAEKFFLSGMRAALTAICNAAHNDVPVVVYYAFKQSEASTDGVTSAGWATFLQAAFDAGFAIDGTWPIRTEMGNRVVGRSSNMLASSIVLVCRKRNANASTITRPDFIRLLRRELPEAIDDIRKAGVGPVDMQQSVIGPGMGVFSRYTKVLEDDDSAMPVKTALAIINRVWEEIDQELDAAFDAETQVALAWFATYGFDAKSSGELITLANAKNISSNALFDSEVFEDLRGKAALTSREKLPKDWSPAKDRRLTIWECVQHTARVLNAEDGGADAAGQLVAQMGPAGDQARKLAYRLFEIATQKGWSQEALIYNELAQEWPRLEDASTRVAQSTTGPAQAAFDL